MLPALIGGLISGGLGLIGSSMQNSAQSSIANANNAFQLGSMREQQAWNSAEADKARWFNAEQAGITRDWSAQQSQIIRDWETGMANTAYQRSMADMRAAGLNPILAGNNGGAMTPTMGTPGGAQASGGQATSGGGLPGNVYQYQNQVGALVSSAVDMARTVQQLDQVKAMTDKTKADTAVSQAMENQVRADTIRSLAQGETEKGRPALQALEADLMKANARNALASSSHHSASALREQAQEYQTRLSSDHYNKSGVFPGTAGNYSANVHTPLGGGGFTLPPQSGREFENLVSPLLERLRRMSQ